MTLSFQSRMGHKSHQIITNDALMLHQSRK